MKPRLSRQRNQALTRTDVVIIIAVLAVLASFLLPALAKAKRRVSKINCISNIKQIGIGFRLWAGDNNDKYPTVVSVTNGGAMELVATGNVAACFRVMSNELSTPKILLCPEDTHRTWATNFLTDFDNTRISYFVGLNVTNETNPQMLLTGDDNFAIGGVPVKPGVLQLLTNTPVTWTKARHTFGGNLGMADGSAQQDTNWGLKNALIQTGITTNQLALP